MLGRVVGRSVGGGLFAWLFQCKGWAVGCPVG